MSRAIPPVFAFHKPKGISSNAALGRIKRILGVKKAGHAGTLDPLAEGVLVVGVGSEGAAALSKFLASEKEYVAEVTFGARSATDDAEGPIEAVFVAERPSQRDIERVLQRFRGEILQRPPRFSAVRVRGKRAYERARKGEAFEIPARPAQIASIEILGYDWPHLRIKIRTGSGVYIRALARDIGDALGVGGYLSALVRTRVEDFEAADAYTFETLGGNVINVKTVKH